MSFFWAAWMQASHHLYLPVGRPHFGHGTIAFRPGWFQLCPRGRFVFIVQAVKPFFFFRKALAVGVDAEQVYPDVSLLEKPIEHSLFQAASEDVPIAKFPHRLSP
jgi:hypothetical protein